MKLTSRRLAQTAVGLIRLVVVAPVLVGAGLVGPDPHGPPLHAGPEGGGSLPQAVTPKIPDGPTHSVKTPTLGRVIDASTRQPIVGALLVVTTSSGDVAGLALTDDEGIFVVYLLDQPGLELAIPSEGLAGLSIEAGDVLTIFVP